MNGQICYGELPPVLIVQESDTRCSVEVCSRRTGIELRRLAVCGKDGHLARTVAFLKIVSKAPIG